MNVLMLITGGFGENGGIPKFNRDFINALSKYNDHIKITILSRHFSADSVSSKEVPLCAKHLKTGKSSKLHYVLAFIKSLLINKNSDLIICGHINLLPLALLAKARYKSPIVLIIHGIDAWTPPRSFFARYCIKHIDALVSVSRLTKDRFLSWANLKAAQCFILPNCIDTTAYEAKEKKLQLLDKYDLKDKKVLLTMGRMHPRERYKGFDEVIDLLPSLSRSIPNITYVIVGEGTDRIRLEKKCKDLGMANRVIFTGYINEIDKADYLRLADAFVMPGRGEGFGIVYLEAMACGVPVVASKLDGSKEAVKEGALGIVVDPNKSDELELGILQALKKTKVVPQGLNFFSFENFTNRLHIIIHKVTKNRQIQ